MKPLLKKKAFHQEERRIGIVTRKAFPNGVVSQKQSFNSGPVNRNVDQFHSLDSPVLFDGVKKRERSAKVRLVFIFLKPMILPSV